MAVYIGSNTRLPTIDWNESEPSFSVQEINYANELDSFIVSKLSKKFIYYVGSHSGCSCGFSVGEYPIDGDSEKDIDYRRKSIIELKYYLIQAKNIEHQIRLYACWEGDQWKEIVSEKEITPERINEEEFWFKEQELLQVK